MVLEKLKHIPDPTYVQAGPLTDFISSLFSGAGMPDEDARLCATVLVDADLNGIDTHGVCYNLDLHYLTGLLNGYINPTPNIQVTYETPGTAVIDADRGMAMMASVQAMELAIEKAKTTGIASVAVKNSSHYGAAGYYARLALKHDMIGFSMSSGGGRVIIPMNGRYPWMGTNPMAFAAPAGDEPPFVIDMASSMTSYGKVSIAQAFGVDIPEGWAQDANGNPVTDITRRSEAIGQPPLGGTHDRGAHKGTGIGIMADVLGGLLPGERLSGMMLDNPKGGRFCHYFQATRIDGFRPADEFKADMDEMLRAFRAQESAPGMPEVLYPGYPDAVYVNKRTETGIPLPRHTVNYFKEMADRLNVEFTIPG
ncbi:MAG: Ldh family oxidoreductase [Chloroflexi bacterium]|nr:Ldh family oxidoreductase [Chloroflexota bacterium]